MIDDDTELQIEIGIGPIGPRLTLRGEVDESNAPELRRTLGRLLKGRPRLITIDLNDSHLLNEAAIELVSELAALCFVHSSSAEVLLTASSLAKTKDRVAYLKGFLLGNLSTGINDR
jgi:hypothetical protein